MRLLLAIGLASIAAGLLLASASAGPPPPTVLHIGVTHEQPTAGRLFTALTFTPVVGAGVRITQVVCDARVRHKDLRGRQQRFYDASNLIAVTCSWLIPDGAGGKRLRLSGDEGRAWVFLNQGEQQTTIGTPVLFWHVQP
jgi:hypothetical protein